MNRDTPDNSGSGRLDPQGRGSDDRASDTARAAAREAALCDLIDLRAAEIRSARDAIAQASGTQASGTRTNGTQTDRTDPRVRAMAMDAALLREFGMDVAVPSAHAMVAGIEERLSQEALRELLEAEQQAPALPSAGRRAGAGWKWDMDGLRDGVLAVLAQSVAVRRVALAAGVALALGGAWLVVQGVRSAWPTGGAGGTRGGLTIARGGSSSGGTGRSLDGHAAVNGADRLVADTDPDAVNSPLASTAGAGDLSNPAAHSATGPDYVAISAATDAPMTLERALALAQAGRLVVRVRTHDAAPLERRLDSMADRGVLALGGLRIDAGRLERLDVGALPTRLASLAQPARNDNATGDGLAPFGPGRTPDAPVVASDGQRTAERFSLPSVTNGFGAIAALRAQEPETQVARVYLAEVPPSTSDLESLKTLLTTAMGINDGANATGDKPRARVASVEFEELGSRSAMDASGVAGAAALALTAGDLDAESVLWWTSAADAWVLGLRVPVVVQSEPESANRR